MFYKEKERLFILIHNSFKAIKENDTRVKGSGRDYVLENANNQRVVSTDGIECELCFNKEYILRRNEENMIVLKECSCSVVRRNKKRIENSNLKYLLELYTFDRYKTLESWQEDVKRLAQNYSQNKKDWFYISGQVGSGKTHIAIAILNELIVQNYQFHFLSWREEAPKLKGYIYNDFFKYEKELKEYKQADVLVIDDFFKGSTPTTISEADLRLAFEIINARYNNKKITIITSEHTLQDLKKFDEAIGTRIIEMSRNSFVSIKKDSRLNIRERREYFD